MGIKGCIFDFDGTLADSMWVWVALGKDFLRRHNLTGGDEFSARLAQLGLETGAKVFVDEYRLEETPEELLGQWLSVAKEKYATEVMLKPGAKEFLEELNERGIKLAVATANQPDPLLLALGNNDVADLFDVALSADEVTDQGKSTPEVYWAAAKRLDVPVEECLVFEDVLGPAKQAHQGGFKVVGAYDNSPAQDTVALRAEADAFIDDYAQALASIEQILAL